MKLKFLLILLLIPELAFSFYVFRPCCCLDCNRVGIPRWWGSADYMLLFRKKRFYPPLVTTSTPPALPVLSDPATTILFGDEYLGEKRKSGGRFDLGFWANPCFGLGGGLFILEKEKIKFHIDGSDAGLPVIGRPFFNTDTNTNDAELVSFPGIADNGSLNLRTTNDVAGFDVYARYRLLRFPRLKFDLLGGFTGIRLNDDLKIDTVTNPVGGLIFTQVVTDKFTCKNDFYGGLLGMYSEWRSKNFALTVTGKVGIGSMCQKVKITGSTVFTDDAGDTQTFGSGLLAQPSNIGEHRHNRLNIVPQISANAQLRIIGCLWATVGYTYTYWHSVALAGEQVDLNINPTQIPGPLSGSPTPVFQHRDTNYWIQGLTAGIYMSF